MQSKLSDHLTGIDPDAMIEQIKQSKETEIEEFVDGNIETIVKEDEEITEQVINVDPEGVLPPEVAKEVEEKINQPEMTKEEEEALRTEALTAYVKQLSTKMRFKKNFTNEYHPGYTKPTLEARTQKRRIKNKAARKSRKANR